MRLLILALFLTGLVFSFLAGVGLRGAPIILPCYDRIGSYLGVCAIADQDAQEGTYVVLKTWGDK